MDNEIWKHKYEKYKLKYLELNAMNGGGSTPNYMSLNSSYKPKTISCSTLNFLGMTEVIAFYYPNYDTKVDTLCGAGFFGNFYEHQTLTLFHMTGKQITVNNVETYFQASKVKDVSIVSIFEKYNNVSANRAFQLKKLDSNQVVNFYNRRSIQIPQVINVDKQLYNCIKYIGNLPGSIATMFEGLLLKFNDNKMMQILKNTGYAYLLEHNETINRDKVWSNNNDGTGSNLLGLLLMIIRQILFCVDDMNSQFSVSNKNSKIFTDLVTILVKCNANSNGKTPLYDDIYDNNIILWIDSISKTTACVNSSFSSFSSISSTSSTSSTSSSTPMCIGCKKKPTWNSQPGEYCSKKCRNRALGSNTNVPMCIGCKKKQTWNRQPGEYCSKKCRTKYLTSKHLLLFP